MNGAASELPCEVCGAVKTAPCRPPCAVADCRTCESRRERLARGAKFCLGSERAKLANEQTNPFGARALWLCNDCLLPTELPESSRALAGTASEPTCPCGGELCCCNDCERAARIVRSGVNVVERVRLARAGGVELTESALKLAAH